VILDFDGPEPDAARFGILAMLAEEYDVMSTERWTEARRAAEAGPGMWLAAARKTGVDTVIAGWVQPEEPGPNSLMVQVLEAASGREIDSFSVKLTADNELTAETAEKLHTDLEEVFNWVGSMDAATTGDDEVEPAAPDTEVDPMSAIALDKYDDLGSIFPIKRLPWGSEITMSPGGDQGCFGSGSYTLLDDPTPSEEVKLQPVAPVQEPGSASQPESSELEPVVQDLDGANDRQ
jgi:hypothetical protein